MTTEARLAEYRARKLQENPNYRSRMSSTKSETKPEDIPAHKDAAPVPDQTAPCPPGTPGPPSPPGPSPRPSGPPGPSGTLGAVVSWVSRVPYLRNLAACRPENLLTWQAALTAVLWLIFWLLFIELEFGAVFLVISGLVFMYKCTRTRPKQEGEASAYSVFNPECERLAGTFTPEHFERQLGLRMGEPT